VVFLPSGTYQISSSIDMRLGTVLTGDPSNPPIIKASPDFQGDCLLNCDDYATHGAYGTTNFMIAVKNIVLDTTAISNKKVVALNWSLAQACALSNVSINMPSGQSHAGHTGILMQYGSPITVTDVVS
jgi:hypothetical protein